MTCFWHLPVPYRYLLSLVFNGSTHILGETLSSCGGQFGGQRPYRRERLLRPAVFPFRHAKYPSQSRRSLTLDRASGIP
jgi:hypothetical protein